MYYFLSSYCRRMEYYFKFLITAAIFIISDLFWIVFNKSLYLNTIKEIQGSDVEIKSYIAIFITYTIMLLGLFGICIPYTYSSIQQYSSANRYLVAFMSGAFYGLIINGIYNLTSYISYKKYSIYVAITDTLWATFLYGSITTLYISL